MLVGLSMIGLSAGTLVVLPPSASAQPGLEPGAILGSAQLRFDAAARGGPYHSYAPFLAADGATPVSDDSAARSMLLTVADFPAGWAEVPFATGSGPPSFSSCDPSDDTSITGVAKSGNFSRGGSSVDGLREQVVIRRDANDFAQVFDRIPGQLDCLTRAINAGQLDDEHTTFTASRSLLPLSVGGDRSAAFRISLRAKIYVPPYPPFDLDLYIDVVYISIGRVGLSLTSYGVDSAIFENTARRAVAKLHQP
jgi:hypothetical protein